MNDVIIIDGVKYQRVVEEELEPAEEPKQDPFDIKYGDTYYWINFADEVQTDKRVFESDRCIEVANACKDATLMEQRAMHETLDRLLWRASVQAGESENKWDGNHNHWDIYYNVTIEEFRPAYSQYCKSNTIYFPSKESAQSAIKNIVNPFMDEHPDFVW